MQMKENTTRHLGKKGMDALPDLGTPFEQAAYEPPTH